jgi:hypothetical protein
MNQKAWKKKSEEIIHLFIIKPCPGDYYKANNTNV